MFFLSRLVSVLLIYKHHLYLLPFSEVGYCLSHPFFHTNANLIRSLANKIKNNCVGKHFTLSWSILFPSSKAGLLGMDNGDFVMAGLISKDMTYSVFLPQMMYTAQILKSTKPSIQLFGIGKFWVQEFPLWVRPINIVLIQLQEKKVS